MFLPEQGNYRFSEKNNWNVFLSWFYNTPADSLAPDCHLVLPLTETRRLWCRRSFFFFSHCSRCQMRIERKAKSSSKNENERASGCLDNHYVYFAWRATVIKLGNSFCFFFINMQVAVKCLCGGAADVRDSRLKQTGGAKVSLGHFIRCITSQILRSMSERQVYQKVFIIRFRSQDKRKPE